MSPSESAVAACRLTLQGPVQGIGLRPTVARLAMELGLAGHVRNAVDGVEIWLEGSDASITEFRRRLTESAPVAASGVSIRQEDREPLRASGFEIITSQTEGAVTTRVPPDQAVCETCRREVETAGNRRYGYAFTSCVDCGPRYSVIESMPYDRCRTSMRAFPLCTVCEKEYTTASDRRFHAQTNACPNCGPNVWLSRQGQRLDLAADAALQETAQALLQGEIVALRGLGGYQLLVDATNTAAIDRLRQRKRRRDKPLAVMVRSLAEAEQIAVLTDQERSLLTSAARPIVLVAVRATCSLNTNIHPGLAEVGLFLPTTPLHWLLLEHAGRPLIVTSGNVEGDPLAVSPVDAERSLNQIADLWLHHDREITRPVDDSVVRFLGDTPVVIRHARGFAPAALPHLERFAESLLVRSPEASGDVPQVLAVGGHQKSAIALYNGRQAILGPHLGDLETLQARQRFDDQARALLSLYRCVPDIIVHDLHPDYFSTTWADSATREFLCQLTETTDKPQRSATACRTIAVQHHHAHVVSGMVQNDWLDREVLGVAFDGTGFGPDGTIWGGEFLRATADEFHRIGHLLPFALPGGEQAVRQPWRVAAALVQLARGNEAARLVLRDLTVQNDSVNAVLSLVGNASLAPITSSVGRLFDGVAALILGDTVASYEGQLAMRLESAADRTATGTYRLPVLEGTPLQLDWRPMIRQILDDRSQKCPASVMSMRFHRGLAQGVADVCQQTGLPVILTGGVFQNRLLTELVLDALQESGLDIGRHSSIPPNDGGLAVGQLAIALARLRRERERRSSVRREPQRRAEVSGDD